LYEISRWYWSFAGNSPGVRWTCKNDGGASFHRATVALPLSIKKPRYPFRFSWTRSSCFNTRDWSKATAHLTPAVGESKNDGGVNFRGDGIKSIPELRGCVSWGGAIRVIIAFGCLCSWLIILVGDLNVPLQILSLLSQTFEITRAATTKQHRTEQSKHASSSARIAAPGTHRPRFGLGEEVW
jgi:hypothetical protein